VLLLQQDLRELQLATAAIRAGIAIVLRRAGVEREGPSSRVLGGRGLRQLHPLRQRPADRASPPRPSTSRGSSSSATPSLAGAKSGRRYRAGRGRRAEELARAARHVDLSQDPNFQNEYVEAMFFPEPAE
jgi:uncharacterized 2Fe-2S/4Fe-4S cluster protein (DUF4445 family)